MLYDMFFKHIAIQSGEHRCQWTILQRFRLKHQTKPSRISCC